jgi:arylsulfatase A-like enzyme
MDVMAETVKKSDMKKNVLLIMTDQMKASSSTLWGNSFCETPALKKLAENGVLYSNAVTPCPLCVPARVSFFTSQYPHQHGSRHNNTPMPAGARHAVKIWKENGYKTGLIGKNHCFERMEDRILFDVWCEIFHWNIPGSAWSKGMEWYRPVSDIQRAHEIRSQMRVPTEKKVADGMPIHRSTFAYAYSDYPLEDYSTGLIAGQTRKFLERYKDEPFFLWVSFPDPHTPYEAPRRYFDMFYKGDMELPPWRKEEMERAPERTKVLYQILGMDHEKEEHVRGVLAAYYGMVKFIDDSVASILSDLAEFGLEEDTIVVFCSDHGDFAGEHMMTQKGGCFYDALTKVPLVVSLKGASWSGATENSPVSLIDVVPTLLELQNIPVPKSMEGSLLPGVCPVERKEAAFSEYGAGGAPYMMKHLLKRPVTRGLDPLIATLKEREAEGLRKMVRTEKWKFIHDPLGDLDELYDLENDPWELHNRIPGNSNAREIDELRERLLDWSIRTEPYVLKEKVCRI